MSIRGQVTAPVISSRHYHCIGEFVDPLPDEAHEPVVFDILHVYSGIIDTASLVDYAGHQGGESNSLKCKERTLDSLTICETSWSYECLFPKHFQWDRVANMQGLRGLVETGQPREKAER
ncbi:hypothetical protein MN608_03561 [Microdochium nivale]|nr:hypothetical protein MN608_03561 [Microdochium nivale]